MGSIFGAEADQGESFEEGALSEMNDEPQPLALSELDLGFSPEELASEGQKLPPAQE